MISLLTKYFPTFPVAQLLKFSLKISLLKKLNRLYCKLQLIFNLAYYLNFMIVKINKSSKINTINFQNLNFGEIFTDHMFVCDFENNTWKEPQILPYDDIKSLPHLVYFTMVKQF